MKLSRTHLDLPVEKKRAQESPGVMFSQKIENKVWPIEDWLLKKLLAIAGNPKIRIRLWDGRVHYTPKKRENGPVMTILNRKTLWRLFLNPNLNFGDDYSRGLIVCEDSKLKDLLEATFRAIVLNVNHGPLQKFLIKGLTKVQSNTLNQSRKNIHHHYDLGNDFYRLWLDDEMTYTCAYFTNPGMSLEEAQVAKMDHVCKKLRLRSGEKVVEAGCGWGGFARHMALNYGVRVCSYNISSEQIEFAKTRARKEGFEDRVEYILDDYRNIKGRNFDVFVSIGMLEHVGRDHYKQLGRVIDRVLDENGRGLIHSIGKNRPEPTCAWTNKRLFPGGYSPSLKEMMEVFEEKGFSVTDVENLRLHYALTLDHWLERYEKHLDWVKQHFDEFFVRAWRLYLAGASANFSAGALQLFQVLFTRPTRNDIPWTRADLYR